MADEENERNNDLPELDAVEFVKGVIDGEQFVDLMKLDRSIITRVEKQAYKFYVNERFEDATVLMEGVAALDDSRHYPFLLLGDLAMRRGDFDEAKTHLERAVELETDHADTLVKLGECLIRSGEDAEALGILRQATEAADGSDGARHRAGILVDILEAESEI